MGMSWYVDRGDPQKRGGGGYFRAYPPTIPLTIQYNHIHPPARITYNHPATHHSILVDDVLARLVEVHLAHLGLLIREATDAADLVGVMIMVMVMIMIRVRVIG